MKRFNIILGIVIGVALIVMASIYVYVGTYIFPIAPHWVTQLPPNPPSPQIKHGEFSFRLEYEISGERKIVEDTLICDFDGFEVVGVGGPKKRKWKEFYKNELNNEIFTFRNETSENTKIVLENIGTYKIVLGTATAEYFLGEPEYYGTPELPHIQVYDTTAQYYVIPDKAQEVFDNYNFKVIGWYCDPPIENSFK